MEAGKFAEAREALLPFARSGNADAEELIGVMYALGLGVEKDLERAFEWYLRSSMKGHPGAQSGVGWYYELGLGMPRPDLVRAYMWYALSSIGGDPDAVDSLEGNPEAHDSGADRSRAGAGERLQTVDVSVSVTIDKKTAAQIERRFLFCSSRSVQISRARCVNRGFGFSDRCVQRVKDRLTTVNVGFEPIVHRRGCLFEGCLFIRCRHVKITTTSSEVLVCLDRLALG